VAHTLRQRECGFTLIEILVAMVIVTVLSAMLVFVATPSAATKAREEARRLAALLELAIAEARAGGQSIAWSPAADGYRFLRRGDDGEWTAITGDSPYRQRALPDGVQLRDVTFAARPLREGERIVISPYGLAGAIAATISAGDAAFSLSGGPVGRVSLVPAQAREDARSHFERSGIHAG
jgi:type II secretion system protein H